MKNRDLNKKQVLQSMAKIMADKEVVRSHMQGKTSIETLNKKGIRFGKPL